MATMDHVKFWWTEPKDKLHLAVVKTADHIKKQQSWRYERYKQFAGMYLDREEIAGFEPGEWRDLGWTDSTDRKVPSYNVIRACTDTVSAKLTLHQPAAKVLTENGPEELQENARNMEQLIGGVIYEQNVNYKSRLQQRDGTLYGMGLLKVYPWGGKVRVDQVHPSRIVVDDQAALNGVPETVYQIEPMSRTRLLEEYARGKGKKFRSTLKLKLKASEGPEAKRTGAGSMMERDLCRVYEAWHLPMGETPGRHVICTTEVVLFDEEWTDPTAPFSVIRWQPDLLGWHGVGLAQELEGLQMEINRTIAKIQANMDLLAVPYLLVPLEAQIVDSDMEGNEWAKIVSYSSTSGGAKPSVELPAAVHPQVFQYLEQLYQRAFELSGVSQLSAGSQLPKGMDKGSGIAIMTVLDTETQRFSTQGRQWEEARAELGRLIIRAGRRVHGWTVRAVAGDFIKKIKWSDCSLKDTQFVMSVQPASSLPTTPAGRLNAVQLLHQTGLFDKEEARELIDMPDLAKAQRMKNASREAFQHIFERMLGEDGEYMEPLEFMRLEEGLIIANQYLCRAIIEETPMERVELLGQWITDAQDMLQPPEPPPPDPGAAGMGGPPPEGMPPGGPEMPAAPPEQAPPMAA